MHFGRTATLGVVSSLVSGASLFLVFRFGVVFAGASNVGTWVLVQSAFILARLPEAGVGINLTRLVAVERVGNPGLGPQRFFLAGLVLTVLPTCLLGLVLIEPTVWLIRGYFSSDLSENTIRNLVQISLYVATLNSMASVALSIIEGFGELSKRHVATIMSNVALALSAYPIIKYANIMGVAMAYAVASTVLSGISLVLLSRRQHPAQSDSVRSIIRRLWVQNATVSGMALVRMSFEPWTKFLVASSGGLVAAAYVDLAFRVTTQVRVAVQSSTQPLLTFGARAKGENMGHALAKFQRAHELVLKVTFIFVGVQILAAPFISFVGVSKVSAEFIAYFVILAVGNSINSLGVVGYYYDASAGHVSKIFVIHIWMMLANLALGAIGNLLIGPIGVVAAYALSFAYGGFALSRSWMAATGMKWSRIAYVERRASLAAVIALFVVIVLVWPGPGRLSDLHLAAGSALLASGLLVASFWMCRKTLQEGLSR